MVRSGGTITASVNEESWEANEKVVLRIDHDSFHLQGDGTLGNLRIFLGAYTGPGIYEVWRTPNYAAWFVNDAGIDEIFAAGEDGGSGTIEILEDKDKIHGSFIFKGGKITEGEVDVEGRFEVEL